MLPRALLDDVSVVKRLGYHVTVVEADSFGNVVFSEYAITPGYSKTSSTVLVRAPLSYRNGRPDMFWTDVDLVLEGGDVPASADVIETYLGRQWRRFSWHPQNWNPAVDDLRTYLEFVDNRLAKHR